MDRVDILLFRAVHVTVVDLTFANETFLGHLKNYTLAYMKLENRLRLGLTEPSQGKNFDNKGCFASIVVSMLGSAVCARSLLQF